MKNFNLKSSKSLNGITSGHLDLTRRLYLLFQVSKNMLHFKDCKHKLHFSLIHNI